MALNDQPLRGGLLENLAGRRRHMILTNAEIERFEDRHGGVFDLWHSFLGEGARPKSNLVRDLIALGLVGAGMADAEADALVASLGPDKNLYLYAIAQGLLGVAFLPDSQEGGGATPEDEGAADEGEGKKSRSGPGGSGL